MRGSNTPGSGASRNPAGDALTDLILGLFRLNNLLLASGDRLVEPLGLTSARWQVLGAIAYADRPQPVAWLARDMGANRQNVQRIVNDLDRAGLITFETNPHHRRAQLVVLTDRGRDTYAAAMHLQSPWVAALANGIPAREIEAAARVLSRVHEKLSARGST